jgi:hypothetical protein
VLFFGFQACVPEMDEPLVADDVQQSLQESLLSKPIYGIASGNEISSVLQQALPAANPGYRVDPHQITTPFGKVSMNKAIKKTYFKGQAKEWSKYSMRIYPEKADFNHFYYLIIDQNKKGKNRGKILALESTQPLNYRNGRANFASFTGLYSVYHLNGDLQIQVPLKNGKIDKVALSGMRAEECEWEIRYYGYCVGADGVEMGNGEEWNLNDYDETDCSGYWVWEVDLTLVCSPDDDGGGTGYIPDYPEDPEFPGGPGSGGDPIEEPEQPLEQILFEDEKSLIPCDELKELLAQLIHFRPSSDVIAYLHSLGKGWDLQPISSASGHLVNLDYFSVKINRLPNGLSPETFLHLVRTNINDFIDPNNGINFTPHSNQATNWQNGFVGTVLEISIPTNKGSVVLSDLNSTNWTFSTITDPIHWNHPVSGNRQFGIKQLPDGSFEFFNSGVDRIHTQFGNFFNTISSLAIDDGLAFSKADDLWRTFQVGIKNFIENSGGIASINSPIINRPKWEKVLEALTNKNPQALPIDCLD